MARIASLHARLRRLEVAGASSRGGACDRAILEVLGVPDYAAVPAETAAALVNETLRAIEAFELTRDTVGCAMTWRAIAGRAVAGRA